MTTETEVLTPELIISRANCDLITQTDAERIISELTPIVPRILEYQCYAETCKVTTLDEAVAVNDKVKAMKADIKTVIDALSDAKKSAHERHKFFTTSENFFKLPIDAAARLANDKRVKWETEQARIAAEQQRKLQAEADERARKEQERLLKQAEKIKTPELKQQRMEEAQTVIAPTVHVEVPKSGGRITKYWTATVTDTAAFFKAVAERPELVGYVKIETTLMTRAKEANPMISIPGITFNQEVR